MTKNQPGHQHPKASGIVDYAGYGLLHVAVDRLGVSEAQLLRALKAEEKKAVIQKRASEVKARRTRTEEARVVLERKAVLADARRTIDDWAQFDRQTKEQNAAIDRLETGLAAARGTTKDPGWAEFRRWSPNERRVGAGQVIAKAEFYGEMAADATTDVASYYLEGAVGGVVGKGAFKGVRRLLKTRPFARLSRPLLQLSKHAFQKLNGGPAAYPVPDFYHRTRFGQWQIARTGSKLEYRVTSRGRTLQIDGLVPSKTSPGKLDIIEAKFSNPDFDDITKSGHFVFWDSKEDQLRRLAQYAKDNKDSVGKVWVVVNKREVGEIYKTLIGHLDKDLQRFVDVDVFL